MKKIIIILFVAAFLVSGCRLATPSPQPGVNQNAPAQNQNVPVENQNRTVNEPAIPYPPYPNNNTNSEPAACKDYCGDGVCQEIVCLAIGCPCSESQDTCPQDCA